MLNTPTLYLLKILITTIKETSREGVSFFHLFLKGVIYGTDRAKKRVSN